MEVQNYAKTFKGKKHSGIRLKKTLYETKSEENVYDEETWIEPTVIDNPPVLNCVDLEGEATYHALTDLEEKKPAIFCAMQSNASLVRPLLFDAGVSVNRPENEWRTPSLHGFEQRRNVSMVRIPDFFVVDVNITDDEGNTALFRAVHSNDEREVRALLKHENSLTSSIDIYGRTPLFYAMTKSKSMISCLLEARVNMRIKDNCGMSFLPFFVDQCISSPAYSHADEALTKQLITEKIDLLVEKGVKKNTVYQAIINISFCKCPLLFYSGINVPMYIFFLELAKAYCTAENESDIDNLLEMVRKTVDDKTLCLVPEILDLLCELGADPNSTDKEGNTALHYATCLPFHGVTSNEAIMELLKKLKETGVTVNKKNHQSETPLLFCLTWHSNGHHESNQLSAIKILVEVCVFLIKNGSNVREVTKKGETVLHLIMRLLQQILEWHGDTRLKDAVEVGIELFMLFSFTRAGRTVINKKDESLNSPIHLWALLEPPHECLREVADGRRNFSVFMKLVLNKLLNCEAQLNDRNELGQTPLHMCKTWIAVELLIDSGANPNVVDSVGCSPLIVAAENNKTLLKARKTLFYPDVEVEPKDFLKSALERGLDPWIVDEHGNSVLSCLMEAEAAELAQAMIEVAYIDGFLKSENISMSLLNAICKNNSMHLSWKSNLVETILKSANLVNVKTSLPLGLCCRNIIEASKTLSVNKVQSTVHWTIAKQLLLYGADHTIPDNKGQSCLDIAEEFPPLKELLSKPIDMDKLPLMIPWFSVSMKHKNKLVKVARHLESECVESYWYHKDCLARGSFGAVFAGINQKDGREVAIKRIEKIRMQRPEDKREIANLTALADCEQVVRYLSFFDDEHFFYIVLELMEGNLDDFLGSLKSVKESILLCQDVVLGINNLHSQFILHRDLKPSNILYKTYPKLCLKIADFGLSRRTDSTGSSTSVYGSNVGTRCWIAPEVLKSTKAHSMSSDIFACGLVLHYLITGRKHPFAPANCGNRRMIDVTETENNIIAGKMEGWDDSQLCPESADLIKAMLDGNEINRPSAAKALDHPLFWPKRKKQDFLIAVGNQPEFECTRPRRTPTFTAVKTDLENSFGTIVKYVYWNDPGYVHMPAIYAEMTRRRAYNTHSVVELIRFIRNALVYASTNVRPMLIRKKLLEDFVFLEYFPHLVVEVYKAVTIHQWDQTRKAIKYAMHK